MSRFTDRSVSTGIKPGRQRRRRAKPTPSTHAPLQVQASAIMAQAPYIRGLLRGMRIPEQDQDDVVQDVIATAWHRVSEGRFQPDPKLKLEASIRMWLYGITWRHVSHYRERAHRRREMPAGDPFGAFVACKWLPKAPTPDDAYAASEILEALDRIPAKFSVVLVLRFFEGFDVIELGELLHGPWRRRGTGGNEARR